MLWLIYIHNYIYYHKFLRFTQHRYVYFYVIFHVWFRCFVLLLQSVLSFFKQISCWTLQLYVVLPRRRKLLRWPNETINSTPTGNNSGTQDFLTWKKSESYCGFQRDRPMARTANKSSLVNAMLDVAFGLCDRLTSRRQTAFCGEFIRVTH